MGMLKRAIAQAIVLGIISVVIAFSFNAISDNGIDPFRKVGDVPVLDEFMHDAADPSADGIRFIETGEFKALLESGMVAIDARTRSEYLSGHIPGALHMDYYEFMRYLDEISPYLSPEKEFVIYCTGPDCSDSELLARELYALGYRKIAIFKGGIHAWCDHGYTLESGNGEEY